MKRVVIVGADFAPSSMPPAQRIRFFAQHLPEFGWHPIILTTDPRFYEWSVDPENENLVRRDISIIRTPAFSAARARKLGIGDIAMRSLWYQRRTLGQLLEHKQADLVFIPVAPYVSMVLGRMMRDRFGTPYVIDYMDPWITDYYWQLPRAKRPPKWVFADALARICEPYALKRVSHIIGVSTGTTRKVISRYPWLSEQDTTEIPLGGEPSDFDYVRLHPRVNPIFSKDGLLHISYVGVFVEPMRAVIETVFAATRAGLARSPELFAQLRLHFVGTSYAPKPKHDYHILSMAKSFGIDHYVQEHPARVSYLDSLQIMLDSHALLAVGLDTPHYTASKIFPYILARRPLLAVFRQESNVVQIVRETQAGMLIPFGPNCPLSSQVTEITAALEALLRLPPGHQPATRWDAFEPYSTRAMTERLASVFDCVVA